MGKGERRRGAKANTPFHLRFLCSSKSCFFPLFFFSGRTVNDFREKKKRGRRGRRSQNNFPAPPRWENGRGGGGGSLAYSLYFPNTSRTALSLSLPNLFAGHGLQRKTYIRETHIGSFSVISASFFASSFAVQLLSPLTNDFASPHVAVNK